MAEAFLAGLVGFLVGRGVPPQDARAVVEGLRTYLGFEPPLGLTGYSLMDISKGDKKKTCVVVRGKSYDALALEDIIKHSKISVLGKRGAYLEVAPTIESLKHIEKIVEVTVLKTLETIGVIQKIENVLNFDNFGFRMKEYNYILNTGFETGDLSNWKFFADWISIFLKGEFPFITYHGKYGVKNSWSGSTDMADLYQYIATTPVSDGFELNFACRKYPSDAKVKAFIEYTDATETTQVFDLDPSWKTIILNAVAGKRIYYVGVCNDCSVGVVGDIYYDDIMLLKP